MASCVISSDSSARCGLDELNVGQAVDHQQALGFAWLVFASVRPGSVHHEGSHASLDSTSRLRRALRDVQQILQVWFPQSTSQAFELVRAELAATGSVQAVCDESVEVA